MWLTTLSKLGWGLFPPPLRPFLSLVPKKRIQPKSDPFTEVIGCSSEYDIDLIA